MEPDNPTPFNIYLIRLLYERSRELNNSHTLFFSTPNEFYHVAIGVRQPTPEDFTRIAAFLDVSEDYLIELYNQPNAPIPQTAPRAGGG